MKITERRPSAIKTADLSSKPDTTWSDSDVLGAYGLAAKVSPLAVALSRLFSGDDRASFEIIDTLATMAVGKAYRIKPDITHASAVVLATLVLGWFRDGTCKACGGHGYKLIPGTPSIGDQQCDACKGRGKRDFDGMFSVDRLELAIWMQEETDHEMRAAGPIALARLKPNLDL